MIARPDLHVAPVTPEREAAVRALRVAPEQLPFVGDAGFNLDDARLVVFQQAISQGRCVFLRYHSYTRDEATERVVEPLRLTFSGEAWYLSAFCQLRRLLLIRKVNNASPPNARLAAAR